MGETIRGVFPHQYGTYVKEKSWRYLDHAEIGGIKIDLASYELLEYESPEDSSPFCGAAEWHFVDIVDSFLYQDDENNFIPPFLDLEEIYASVNEECIPVRIPEVQRVLFKIAHGRPTGLVITPGPLEGVITTPAFSKVDFSYCRSFEQFYNAEEREKLTVMPVRRADPSVLTPEFMHDARRLFED